MKWDRLWIGALAGGLAAGIAGCVGTVPDAGGAAPAAAAQAALGWGQVGGNGLGNANSGEVSAVETFGGYLYAGTHNATDGAQIFRSSDGVLWIPVTQPGFGNPHDIVPPAVLDFVVFTHQFNPLNYLYASTGRGNASQIWRSSDGMIWAPMDVTGFGDPDNTDVTALAVYGGKIYAGVTNQVSGAQIWSSFTGDNNTWTQVAPAVPGTAPATVTGFAGFEFDGGLYAAVESEAPAQVWRSFGGDWEIIVDDGFGDADTVSTGGMAVFGGYLYVGAGNAAGGAQLWRTNDGASWEQAIVPGFGDPNNQEVAMVFVFQNQLYAGVRNVVTGMEIWRSADGTVWEQANQDGFGDANNTTSNWNNATAAFLGHLYVGTSNVVDGGELWRMQQCGNGVIEAGEQCDDGNVLDGDCCSATCQFEAFGSSCADGVFCNGQETCDGAGACVRGPAVDCNDGVDCTVDACVEATGLCSNTPNDDSCPDDQLFCNGIEVCDPQLGCSRTGTPCELGMLCSEADDTCTAAAACGNGLLESGEECDDNNLADGDCCSANCTLEPVGSPCPDGFFCNGAETCDGAGACLAGAPVDCSDGVACTADSCDEANDVCVSAPMNPLCDDGTFCNGVETCDPVAGCQPGTPVACDDGIGCTEDSCNEEKDACDFVASDARCPDDGVFCNGAEFCDPHRGCSSEGDPCPGGTACSEPTDACAPGVACGNGILEIGEQCDDGNLIDGDCCSANCTFETAGTSCADALFCNGDETCDGAGACRPGAPVDCSDGIACTTDACDEVNHTCVSTPNDNRCPDDGQFCTGQETCDTAQGCVSSGDPCWGGGVCNDATSTCDPIPVCGNGVVEPGEQCDDGNPLDGDCCAANCTFEPAGNPCPDGLFCNGDETCDGGGTCLAGTPPDPSDGVCADFCDEDGDGDIDTADLTLISQARGQQASGPDDPRDADGDGLITPNDVKVCIPICTRPNCAIL